MFKRQNVNISVVRACILNPSINGLERLVHPGLIKEFESFISNIWSELIDRLHHPIVVKETVTRRSVTVLKSSRYVIDRRSGKVSIEQPDWSKQQRRFRKATFRFSVDLPFVPSIGLFEELLKEWRGQLLSFVRSNELAEELFFEIIKRIRRSALRSVYWKRLRYAVRDALSIDPDVLALAHKTRVNTHARELVNVHFNQVIEHTDALRQIERDNSNLLWVYGLALDQNVTIHCKNLETVEAIKQKVVTGWNLTPVAWRYLANGHRKNFRVVLDFLGPNASPAGRWTELGDWLRLLSLVDRQTAIPLPVQRLFLHDAYRVDGDEHVIFRGVRLPIHTLRCLVSEAEQRLQQGTLRAFAENELVDVLSWIGDNKIVLDSNQQKAGWKYLVRKSSDWKFDQQVKSQSQSLNWTSLISTHSAGSLECRAIDDIWKLHREALGRRNCCNGYLGG